MSRRFPPVQWEEFDPAGIRRRPPLDRLGRNALPLLLLILPPLRRCGGACSRRSATRSRRALLGKRCVASIGGAA
jgi:hypothetical protein